MSGHSKWSSIKHKKALKDARRGKLFTKLIKEITVAARMGGSDVSANPRLRAAVQTARQNSMPTDNIERAIKRGTGELEGVTYDEITYEGYGPGGVAILAEVMTDNRNRTNGEIKKIFERANAAIGVPGCVSYMFDRKGFFAIDAAKYPDEDKLMELALNAGAEDLRREGDVFEITCDPSTFSSVMEALKAANVEAAEAEVKYLPKMQKDVDTETGRKVVRLIEAL